MALISCISCGAKISDKAVACPKCGWTNQSEPPLANTEELRIEEEHQSELNKKRDYYLGLEAKKVNKKEVNNIGFFQVLIPTVFFLITGLGILFSLPDSTWVECGEKYWDYDRERYVRKKC